MDKASAADEEVLKLAESPASLQPSLDKLADVKSALELLEAARGKSRGGSPRPSWHTS